MRNAIFGDGENLQDVAAKRAFDVLKVDFGDIITHHLLGCVVDQYVNFPKYPHMLRHRVLTRLVIHQVPRDKQALTTLCLYHRLGVLGVGLLFWKVDNADVGALPGEEHRNGAPDSRTNQ